MQEQDRNTVKDHLETADQAAAKPPAKTALHDRVRNDFAFHKPNAEDMGKLDHIRLLCSTLAHNLVDICPEGRDLSMAITSLEETQRSAVAAIAKQGPVA